jgi:AcrR family transcriptional regulator
MRADAAERRARLLEAGRDLFADVGYDVPLETIAKRAGVGIATLYRNFPTRQDLKIALLSDGLRKSRVRLDVLLEEVEEDPGGAISRLSWMYVSLRLGALIPIIGRDLDHLPSELVSARSSNLKSVAEILRRAQLKGAVREDITVFEFLTGLALLTRPQPALEKDPMMPVDVSLTSLTERVIEIFLAGLRPQG